MKVDVKKVKTYDEEYALINAVEITEDLQNAIDILSNNCRVIPVMKEDKNIFCSTDQIYFIESIDKKTFIYTRNQCFECKYRLYELEEILNKNFFRTSKAMIVNIRKMNSVKAEFNGRMICELINGEKIIISRSYVKALKERLEL